MVLAYHAIFGAYGFWLPNDPRGSWSDWVRSWELLRFGPATTVSVRHSIAHEAHDDAARIAAKDSLAYPPVSFSGRQAAEIGNGFHQAVHEAGYVIYACAILPEHTHVVVRRHERRIEQVVRHLKGNASRRLTTQRLHPLARYAKADGVVPTPWARGCWRAYLNDEAAVRRAIEYVEENPLKEGKPRQRWPFVVPCGG